jgi:signal transduction histidine kinase/ActR/RegA family two-component response regulator
MDDSSIFLSCSGEMASLTTAFDWASTPLGPPARWPDALKTTVNILLNSNHPMFILWGEDLIQFYNDAARKTMGPERHPSALGQPARECWQETWPIMGPQIESILAGGPSTWHEDQLVPLTRHGSRQDTWWTYGYSPIRDSTGIRGILVTCNDVTEEHLAKDQLERLNKRLAQEIRLRQHEGDRLKVLFQQAPGFMCVLRGSEHVFEFVNDAYVRLVGSRELCGKRVRDVFPEVEGQGFFELLDQVFATGQPFFAKAIPLSLRRGSAEPLTQLFLDFVYQPIIESDGAVSGIFVEGYDVTEQRQAQEALRISEERLKEGMVAARMAVWDWDLGKGELEFCANAEVFGVTPARLPPLRELLHPDDVPIMTNAWKRAIAERGKLQEVVRIIHPENKRIFWSGVWGKVHCDEANRPLCIRGVALDITERKRAEEKLQEADRRKDEFLAMLAHELRNPLAPISAAAQVLSMTRHDDVRISKISEIVIRQVEHMSHMIDDLLDVARVTQGQVFLEKLPVDLRSLLSDAVEQVKPMVERRGHRLVLPQIMEPFPVLGDRKRLVQVITNLLNNAAKYTPEGGNILVSLECRIDHIVLTVQDDGIGIDQELLPHVFEPFTQAKRSADRSEGGLGLGLSLVKGLVESHGGSVMAESEGIGAGAKFTVTLPRYSELAPSMTPKGETSISPPAEKIRIMIVDDNKDAAVLMSMVLEVAGFDTFIEHDPYRALERARIERPDVGLLDIGLPGMDGNELARRLRSTQGSNLLLAATTGYGQENDRANALAAGFDHYFVKPVDTKEIIALLVGWREVSP